MGLEGILTLIHTFLKKSMKFFFPIIHVGQLPPPPLSTSLSLPLNADTKSVYTTVQNKNALKLEFSFGVYFDQKKGFWCTCY